MNGYDIINPLYCYEGGQLSFKKLFAKEDPINITRSALILNRGWIPVELKDRKTRQNEVNSNKLARFYGVFRKGKNLHDYKVPNDPDSNEWNNLALEDIGIYWDLPNADECKFYYF